MTLPHRAGLFHMNGKRPLAAFDETLRRARPPAAGPMSSGRGRLEFFGTRGLVTVRGTVDGQRFESSELPVKATVRKALGKQVGDVVHLEIDERL
jgi:hypothetical protein